MIVMKFGGTSVEDAPSIERVVEIIRQRLHLRPVVVVSAMGKTTSKLLQAAEASAAGDSRTTLGIVAGLKTRHTSEARRLVRKSEEREVFALIEKHFDELKKLLEGLAILGEVPPRGLDKILAYGELLSSAVLADALTERGIQARLLDARELIKTDDRFGSASPIEWLTNQRVIESVLPVVESGAVPVIQGFMGSSRDGATTTLGFEGSDYTATILGAALDAADIQIWKDVPGLMTADPEIFAGARTVKHCSFAEAAELTHFGAKVLHPKAIHPAARKNIPVHIYNSRKPSSPGTTITASATPSANPIKSITYKRPVTIINGEAASGTDMSRWFLDVLAKRRVDPLLMASAGSHVVLVIDSRDLRHGGRDLIEAVSGQGKATAEANCAVVSVVGEGLGGDPAVVSQIFNAIKGIEVGLIVHGSSPLTISVVVAESDVEQAVSRLHGAFFEKLDPQVFE